MLAFNRTCSKNKTSRHYYDSITKSIVIQIYILQYFKYTKCCWETYLQWKQRNGYVFKDDHRDWRKHTKTVLTTGRHKLFVSQQKQVRNGYVHGHCWQKRQEILNWGDWGLGGMGWGGGGVEEGGVKYSSIKWRPALEPKSSCNNQVIRPG